METDIRLDNIESEMKAIKEGLLKTLLDLKESLSGGAEITATQGEVVVNIPVINVPPAPEAAPVVVAKPPPELPTQPAQSPAAVECETPPQATSIQPEPRENQELIVSRESSPVLPGTVSLARVKALTEWADNTCAELGLERTLSLLEIAVIMGYMPADLKSTVEKCLPDSGPAKVYTRSLVRAQLKALKDLAPLLDKKREADFVMLQIAAQVLFSYSWPNPEIAPAEN